MRKGLGGGGLVLKRKGEESAEGPVLTFGWGVVGEGWGVRQEGTTQGVANTLNLLGV